MSPLLLLPMLLIYAGVAGNGLSKGMSSEEIDALWDYNHPGETCDKFRAALSKHPENADELHTQICRCLGLQRKFEDGWSELAKISARPSPMVQVRVALESGRLKNSSGDKEGSKPYFLEALEKAKSHHFDFYAVDAAHMLAIATPGQVSLEWNEKAITMASASKDKRTQNWKGSLLNNTGWSYHEMGQFEKALDLFNQALAFEIERGNEGKIRIARWTVGRCLRSLKRYEEALAIQQDLAKYPEAGYVSEELGELYLATGHPDEAKPHFRKAYELLSQDPWLKANEAKRLERLHQLGGWVN